MGQLHRLGQQQGLLLGMGVAQGLRQPNMVIVSA
jgi:hypothetical protein